VFGQILKLFPRSEFDQLVKETQAERHARGFTCWDQFAAMLFCQLGKAQSLRQGLASIEGKLNHLGMEGAPNKSTLAYANAHRPWQRCISSAVKSHRSIACGSRTHCCPLMRR
jgi:hypothetical protein